jgi:hypothetical protein
MVLGESAVQCLAQLHLLLPEAALGERSKLGRVPFAGDAGGYPT